MVLHKTTCQLVASWHGTIDIFQFAWVLYYLGMYYNTACIAVERTGGWGSGVIANLIPTEYPNLYVKREPNKVKSDLEGIDFGWSTDIKTRALVIAAVQEMVMRSDEEIPDRELLLEMQTMQVDKEGKPRGIGKNKDDRVFAYGIALCVRNEELYSTYETRATDKYRHLPQADRIEWARVDKEMEPWDLKEAGVGQQPRYQDLEEQAYDDN